MSREFGVPTEKFSLLPNAVDPIAPLPPRTAGPPTVLTVTRLDRRDRDKNVTQMIDAIGILKSRVPNVRYEIVGAGSLLDELRARAEERGLSDTVVFHGRVSPAHLDEAYRRATVFALPSSKEGFGIVYLEAWLRELPVICSCFGASHEIVSDQEDGFVVDSRSPEEIAERLFQLLSAPPLAQKFGESGRRKVEKMYLNRSFRKNLDRLVDDTIGQSVKT
nr:MULTISPECIES: glycosyltransferase family 4 protein [unclassified Bradyrhizobium]